MRERMLAGELHIADDADSTSADDGHMRVAVMASLLVSGLQVGLEAVSL
jgi:hypothetical protein